MNFSYLDIDNPANDNFKKQLGYVYQPHLFLLDKNGSIIKQWVGFVGEDELRAAIDGGLN